jgi:hypothetical protein
MRYFYVEEGEGSDGSTGLQVIFGTQEEIDNDSLEGDGVTVEDFEYFQQRLCDSGSLCEDYLIDCQAYRSLDYVDDVRSIIEERGYVFNEDLEGIAWG